MILRVAVFAPVVGTFDYLPARDIEPHRAQVGTRVLVPFGRGRRVGVIVAQQADSPIQAHRLRRLHAVLDSEPVLTKDLLRLIRWATTYYRYSLGEAMATALPTRLRQPRPLPADLPDSWRLTSTGDVAASGPGTERAHRQYAVLHLIREHRFDPAARVALRFDWRRPLRELERKGWVERAFDSLPLLSDAAAPRKTPKILNDAQAKAVAAIVASQGQFRALLLHGVTGSGKTEVYLSAASTFLQAGQQVLILVPEIALTDQFIRRIRDRFEYPAVVLHSGCTDLERLRAWRAASKGEARLILGTRSAIWTRCAELGLIIVDEEHDSSYKQGEGFRYSARDTAVMRARQLNIPIVLGSATPSLESCANSASGRYQLLRLPDRAGSAAHPTVRLIDMRRQEITGGMANALLEAVAARRERGEQSLLFINRRGYAPVLLCHNCGWSAECSRCSTRLVYHKRNRLLICHHCGLRRDWAGTYDCCAAPAPFAVGTGTERVEETLRRLWPTARIARIDRDALHERGRWPELVAAIRRQEYDILIGTQMIAKGHHFPAVTLVGVLDVDSALYSVDFRATERLAQLLTQVGGRAGRADKPGAVLLQTHYPQHPLLQTLLARGYAGFVEEALAERRRAAQPPFACWALVRAEAANVEVPRRFLEQVAAAVAETSGTSGVQVLGPVPAPIERRAGRFRWQLLLCSRTHAALNIVLNHLEDRTDSIDARRRVRWSLDVDPQDLY